MQTLSDYINTIGGAASQIAAITNGPPKAAPAPAAPTASGGIPKWVMWAGIGLLVALGGFLLLRRK
jgi:LPXTG-motif cell wall-anchored protein